jgi:hypothetical protein
MEATKILLSAEELSLVQDTHWLLTKNNIIEKARQLFGGLAGLLQEEIGNDVSKFPGSVHLFSPKVFKGEYYQGLPYVMLDYPRVFTKDDVLAMRTMFWWGNFFSVTLQLKGSYQQLYRKVLLKNKEMLVAKGFHVSISGDEWRHDFAPDNYKQMSAANELEEALNGNFLKIAVKIPLANWNDATQLIGEHHRYITGLLMV